MKLEKHLGVERYDLMRRHQTRLVQQWFNMSLVHTWKKAQCRKRLILNNSFKCGASSVTQCSVIDSKNVCMVRGYTTFLSCLPSQLLNMFQQIDWKRINRLRFVGQTSHSNNDLFSIPTKSDKFETCELNIGLSTKLVDRYRSVGSGPLDSCNFLLEVTKEVFGRYISRIN